MTSVTRPRLRSCCCGPGNPAAWFDGQCLVRLPRVDRDRRSEFSTLGCRRYLTSETIRNRSGV